MKLRERQLSDPLLAELGYGILDIYFSCCHVCWQKAPYASILKWLEYFTAIKLVNKYLICCVWFLYHYRGQDNCICCSNFFTSDAKRMYFHQSDRDLVILYFLSNELPCEVSHQVVSVTLLCLMVKWIDLNWSRKSGRVLKTAFK